MSLSVDFLRRADPSLSSRVPLVVYLRETNSLPQHLVGDGAKPHFVATLARGEDAADAPFGSLSTFARLLLRSRKNHSNISILPPTSVA